MVWGGISFSVVESWVRGDAQLAPGEHFATGAIVNTVEFIQTYQNATLSERSVAIQHFLHLCDLLHHPHPVSNDPTGEAFRANKCRKWLLCVCLGYRTLFRVSRVHAPIYLEIGAESR